MAPSLRAAVEAARKLIAKAERLLPAPTPRTPPSCRPCSTDLRAAVDRRSEEEIQRSAARSRTSCFTWKTPEDAIVIGGRREPMNGSPPIRSAARPAGPCRSGPTPAAAARATSACSAPRRRPTSTGGNASSISKPASRPLPWATRSAAMSFSPTPIPAGCWPFVPFIKKTGKPPCDWHRAVERGRLSRLRVGGGACDRVARTGSVSRIANARSRCTHAVEPDVRARYP